MPLYGRGLKKPGVLRMALLANDWLSRERNRGLRSDRHIPSGRIVSREETLKICPEIDTHDLEGAALWWDATMPDSQRLLMEVLRWSTECGATALNYVQAEKLLVSNRKVHGIEALDRCSGRKHEFRGKVVINATGPWVRETADALDHDYPSLFRPTIAWNILIDRPSPAETLLTIEATDTDAQTFFVQPFKGRTLVGTGHAEWGNSLSTISPTRLQIQQTLTRLNSAMPGLDLKPEKIVRVFSGLLPGKGENGLRLADRPVIVDHGQQGGTRNFISVSGVKFTTARRVANSVLDIAIGRCRSKPVTMTYRPPSIKPNVWSCSDVDSKRLGECMRGLRFLVEEEAVVHLDDLVFRRRTLWENSNLFPELAQPLCSLFPWDTDRRRAELDRLATAFMPMAESKGMIAE
jgi:glycerol-3-phosphate dehydrogenase